jgi:hypothetical protein
VVKKAEALKMTPEPGPEVEGYVPKIFVDAVPDGGEEVIRDAGLAIDIENAAEPEEAAIKKKRRKIKKKK